MAQPEQPLFGINTTNNGLIVIFDGGIPLIREGEIAGAIGVSGGAVGQDQTVAEAGIEAFRKETKLDETPVGSFPRGFHEVKRSFRILSFTPPDVR
jgi:hypothetical protein